jgi:hypothetical protein
VLYYVLSTYMELEYRRRLGKQIVCLILRFHLINTRMKDTYHGDSIKYTSEITEGFSVSRRIEVFKPLRHIDHFHNGCHLICIN